MSIKSPYLEVGLSSRVARTTNEGVKPIFVRGIAGHRRKASRSPREKCACGAPKARGEDWCSYHHGGFADRPRFASEAKGWRRDAVTRA